MITISNLSKTYGFVKALRDISLQFEEGNVYGIVGANGAGKTTLFRCMAGLLDYTGQIIYPQENMKNHMGFLASEPYFLSFITGREYLRLLCNARKITDVNIDESNIFELPLDRFVTAYSTGMKKKLALLGILLQKNSLFILDEPFNGVDIQSNMLIGGIIHKLKTLGKTVIISSHILSTLADTCDNIILLKEGKADRNFNRDAFQEIEQEMLQAEIMHTIDKLKLD